MARGPGPRGWSRDRIGSCRAASSGSLVRVDVDVDVYIFAFSVPSNPCTYTRCRAPSPVACSDPMHWPPYPYRTGTYAVWSSVKRDTGERAGRAKQALALALAPTRPGRTANGPRARPYGARGTHAVAGRQDQEPRDRLLRASADESQRAAADYRPWLFGRRTAQAPPQCWADLTHRPCLSGSARVCFRRPLRSLCGHNDYQGRQAAFFQLRPASLAKAEQDRHRPIYGAFSSTLHPSISKRTRLSESPTIHRPYTKKEASMRPWRAGPM